MHPSHYLDLLQPLMSWLHQHPLWACFFTFLIAFTESLVVVGYVVPGSIILAAIGTLVGAGILSFVSVYLWALAGAILGDGASYIFGVYFKDRIPSWWPFCKYPHWLQAGESFFATHGGTSVFLGRFVGPIRPIVPMIAGMLKMPARLFFISNISSAIFWAPLYMIPGILLGAASSQLEPQTATRVLIISVILLFTIALSFTLLKWLYTTLKNLCHQRFNDLWRWINQLKHYQWLTSLLKDARHRHNYRQFNLGVAGFICVFSFLILSGYIFYYGSEGAINQACHYWFRSMWHPSTAAIMVTITFLGTKEVVLTTSFLIMLYLGCCRRWRALILLGLALIAAVPTIYLVKFFIHSPRPWGLTLPQGNHSYPSGHTTLAVTAYSFLAFLMGREMKSHLRWLPYGCAFLLCFWIMISRLYLGDHWLTDIIGGALLGLIFSIGATLLYRRHDHQPLPRFSFIAICCLSLGLTTTVYNHFYQQTAITHHTPLWPKQPLSLEQWWHADVDTLTLVRRNAFGQPVQLFNIQWLGDLSEITQHLKNLGWQKLEKNNNVERLNRLFAKKSQHYLSIFPLLHQGKPPILTMTKKNAKGKLIILRLWQAHLQISHTPSNLWLGNIMIQHKKVHHAHSTKEPAITYLTLPTDDYCIKRITLLSPSSHLHKEDILLIKPMT